MMIVPTANVGRTQIVLLLNTAVMFTISMSTDYWLSCTYDQVPMIDELYDTGYIRHRCVRVLCAHNTHVDWSRRTPWPTTIS
jgi:hypothetical protein